MSGAEPFSAAGGPAGVLVLHGFTGNPHSVRGLAEAFAATGFSVELPLLPGHGTSPEEMETTRWEDWVGAAERTYTDLARRCDRVVLAGLSMGGSICCWLAARHPEVSGLVVVNPFIDPPAESFRKACRQLVASGTRMSPNIGSDIARPGAVEVSYPATPIACLLSLCEGLDRLQPRLGDIRCPVLIMTSREDHVVPPVSSDVLAERVSGPVERVFLDRSYHVATLDYDQDEIEARAVEFAGQGDGGLTTRQRARPAGLRCRYVPAHLPRRRPPRGQAGPPGPHP